jgi:hypothetical protein
MVVKDRMDSRQEVSRHITSPPNNLINEDRNVLKKFVKKREGEGGTRKARGRYLRCMRERHEREARGRDEGDKSSVL